MATDIARMSVKLGLDMSGFAGGIIKAEKTLKKFGANMTAVGKKLSTRLTAPLLGIAAIATKTFVGFEKQMNNVKALTGTTGAEFQKLSALATELGRTTAFSSSQAAEGMSMLAKAGLSTEEILQALPKTLQLAAAAQIDLGSAANITTGILGGMRLEVSQLGMVNDVLAKTATSTKTDVAALGQSFKFVGPFARSAGIEFKETTAILGLLAQNGIVASQAGTGLRQTIAKLLKPATEAKKAMAKFGFEFKDATGKLIPFVEILKQLEDSTATGEDLLTIFGIKGGAAIQAIVGQSGDLEEFNKVLDNVGGTAERIAKTQLEGLIGDLVRMKSAVQGAFKALGAELKPILGPIFKGITSLAAGFTKLNPTIKKIILSVGIFAGSVGPLLLGIGAITAALPAMVAALALALPVIGSIALAISGVVVTIGTMLAAGFLLGVVARTIIANWERLGVEFSRIVDGMGNKLRDFALGATKAQRESSKLGKVIRFLSGAPKPEFRVTEAEVFGPGGMPKKAQTDLPPIVTFTEEAKRSLEDFGNFFKGIFGGVRKEIDKTLDPAAVGEKAKETAEEVVNPFATRIFSLNEMIANNAENFKTWFGEIGTVLTQFQELSRTVFEQFSAGIGNALANVIVFGESLATQLKSLMQSIAKTIISTLVKIGVQRGIQAIAAIIAAKRQTAGEVTAAAPRVFAGQFAAQSSAPFPLNLLAPAVATKMLGLFKAGVASAGPLGALAGGGIVSPPGGIFEVGEGGEAEVVAPLSKFSDMAGTSEQTIIFKLGEEELTRAVVRGMPSVLEMDVGVETV